MQAYLERQPVFRAILLLMCLAALVGIYILVAFTRDSRWLGLAAWPAVIAIFWISPKSGWNVLGLTLIIFLLAGVQADSLERSGIWMHLPVIGLLVLMAFLFQNRTATEKNSHQEAMLSLDEQLAVTREQYKINLVVNVSNRKKMHKYLLLSRVSHALGSQLQLDKLADAVIREVFEIMGPERGAYSLSLNRPGHQETLIRSMPESRPAGEGVPLDNTPTSTSPGLPGGRSMDDAFGLWAIQHRTSLLLADTHDDFRFQAPGPGMAARSLMVSPLLADGRVIGMLRAESPWVGMFTPDDLRLFTVISDLAAAAAENARLYQHAQELAITDGLTGLYLRRFFNQRFDEELMRFQEHGTPFTLLILDLDHFKRINDRLGHVAGDQILIQVADILKKEARIADITCRFGGEEFALILPNTPAEGGLIMAERIRVKIAERGFLAGSEAIQLTVSIGLGECPRHGRNQLDLVKSADEALYTAKRTGRNNAMMAVSRRKKS